jgi:hypothetical protein
MDEPIFCDKQHVPTEADLADALGRAKGVWDRVVAEGQVGNAGVTAEWKHYAGKSGWTLVLRAKQRNVLYLKPLAKQFLACFALGEKAMAAAEQADLPAPLREVLRAAPLYPEGRAVRICVKSAADAAMVGKLLAIKIKS